MSLRPATLVSALLCGTAICIFVSPIQPVDAQAVAEPTLLPSRLFTELNISGPVLLALQVEPPAQKNTPAPASPIPEGKGKDLTLRLCTTCHAASQWSELHHTREEWSAIIDNMVSKGLEASDEDLTTVNNYLATNLGPAK